MVSEKSGKSQGILLTVICGNPEVQVLHVLTRDAADIGMPPPGMVMEIPPPD